MYTKDIILSLNYKRRLGIGGMTRSIKDNIKNTIKNNKYLFFILTFLVLLITIDFVLVNTFLNIITNSFI